MTTTRTIRFRVESNKAKSTFWYTMVAGNGNTVMTSKAKYFDHATAKRAAIRAARALNMAPLAIEYTTASGQVLVEPVQAEPVQPDVSARVLWEYLPPELTKPMEGGCSSHGH